LIKPQLAKQYERGSVYISSPLTREGCA